MSSNLTREYISILRNRYRRASRREKKIILDEFCATTGLHRKYSIRKLNSQRPLRKRPGREPFYSEETIRHLRRLWVLMDQMCSKKMVAAFPYWLPFYDCPAETKMELLTISPATIDRKLKPYRAPFRRQQRSGTASGRFIKHVIPIKTFQMSVTVPGHVEADTVAHCGGFMAGEFIWSLCFTDVFSGWTEVRSILGKSAIKVVTALKNIEMHLPFPIRAFNSDNGSEFLNAHLLRHYGEGKMTRSRPYRKNDNCYIEQKNFTHVRELFGYERFDRLDLVPLMNDIYTNEHRLLQNFFVPQLKLKHKLRVGSRYKRVYTEPRTPYQILLECESLPAATKDGLKAQFESLNPFYLRRVIEAKMRAFFKALRGVTDEKTGS